MKLNLSSLFNKLKTCRYLKPVIPAGIIGAVIAVTLSGYEAPVYVAKTPEIITSEDPSTGGAPSLALPDTTALPEEAKQTDAPAAGAIKTLSAVNDANKTYQDGTYSGSAQGFGGPISVQVTVQGGKITAITITSASGETPEYLSRAKALINNIISGQTTNVDVVSGATYSSNGIIQAVRNALSQASGGNGAATAPAASTAANAQTDTSSAKKGASSSKKAPKVKKTDESNAQYKDGTYIGSAEGFGGPIKVSVTIKKGKIVKIKITSAADETPEFFDQAKGIADTIVSAQTTNVDVVSGATYSSNGIIEAVRDALSKASVSPSSSKSGSKKQNDTKKTDSGQTSKKPSTGGNDSKKTETPKPVKKIDESTFTYNDGTFSGSAEGYGGTITVTVTVSKDKITAIEITEHSGETRKFFEKAAVLPDQIIAAQSTNVDVVSGATYTSNGIIEAVRNALTKALADAGKSGTSDTGKTDSGKTDSGKTDTGKSDTGKSDDGKSDTGKTDGDETGTTDPGSTNPESGKEEGSETGSDPTADDDRTVYAVSGTVYDMYEDFYDYEITMNVVIRDGKIIDITDLVNTDHDSINASYLKDAAQGYGKYKGVIKQIIEKGTPEGIDVVSEATCSSEAIIEAAKEALQKDKSNP